MGKSTEGRKNPNWRGGKVRLVCGVCRGIYFKFPSQASGRSKYCSKKCFYARHPHLPVRDGKGYIWLFKPSHPNATPNGYIKEHRYVMEQKIGRLLKRNEVVHHVNGIVSDNRPENLEIFATHSEHMKHHHSSS